MKNEKSTRQTIKKLFDWKNGKEVSALDLLATDEKSCFELRRRIEAAIQKKEPLFACDTCGQPVGLRSLRANEQTHTFYFKHLYNSGDCEIKTGKNYTKEQIRRMKYNGAKESLAHIELKNYIYNHLLKDNRFKNIKMEEVIRGKGWSKEWKKPDISAEFNGRQVVFEIQLSTTFLDVIVKRESFYKERKTPIFWVFKDFNPLNAKATEKDIFFNNKSNALSIDSSSKYETQRQGELYFTGYYQKTFYDKNIGVFDANWDSKLVCFDEFQYDLDTFKPYFIDIDREQEKLIEKKNELERDERKKILLELERLAIADERNWNDCKECAEKLRKIGLYKSEYLDDKNLNLLKALFSLRDNKVYIKNQSWNWLANYVWDNHKNYWLAFIWVVKLYGLKETIFCKENIKLNQKHDDFKKNMNIKAVYAQDKDFYSLFLELFPELKGHLPG